MEEFTVMLGFEGGNFFIGKKVGDKLVDCLVFTFEKDDKSGKIITNLTNPIPFNLMNKETNTPYRPEIPISNFLYVADTGFFKDNGEMKNFYLKCLEEENKIFSEVNSGKNKEDTKD